MAKVKYPKALGACVDQLYEARAARLALNAQVEAMKVAEAALEDHILNKFGKDEIRGAKGDVATAAIKMDTSVNTTDWDAYRDYVVKHKAWDMLRKQPATTAVKARWANGEAVPGVERFTKISLSLTKVGS